MIREWRVPISARPDYEVSLTETSAMNERIEERLYRLNGTSYVQYDMTDELPEELAAYIANHRGEYPPYMPLPSYAVDFRVEYIGTMSWPGTGTLPAPVLKYVRDNGVLPRYSATGVPSFDDDDTLDDEDWDEDSNEETDEWMD